MASNCDNWMPPAPLPYDSPCARLWTAGRGRLSLRPEPPSLEAALAAQTAEGCATTLGGKCFNCLGEDHIRAQCVSKPCCINYGSECHRRRDCPFPPLAAPGKRPRSTPPDASTRRAAPRLTREPRRRPTGSDDTISGRSVSTPLDEATHRAAPRLARGPRRRPAGSGNTISGRSVSSGRSTSLP